MFFESKLITKENNNQNIFIFLGGWPPNANSGGQYRAQYPPQAGPQQWAQGPRPGQPQGPNQWDQNRYPVNQPYGPVINLKFYLLYKTKCFEYFRTNRGQVRADLHS